jgi:hypothetical protein
LTPSIFPNEGFDFPVAPALLYAIEAHPVQIVLRELALGLYRAVTEFVSVLEGVVLVRGAGNVNRLFAD